MIPHNRPTLTDEDIAAATRVLKSGMLVQRDEVAAFEEELCEYLKVPKGHAVAVSSGSSALYLALHILEVKGRPVYQPLYTCNSLCNATRLAGGRPEFIDTEKNLPNMSFEALTKIKDVVIVPHMYGIPTDVTRVPGTVIEDCAQAIGSQIGGKMAGTLGKLSVFSFYATKLLTSGGQGGALVSGDKELIKAARDFRNFDCRDDRGFRINIQMTDLLASIGRVQLKALPKFVERREEIFARYKEAGIPLMDTHNANVKPVRFRAVARCAPGQQAGILTGMKTEGITCIVPIEAKELMSDAQKFPQTMDLTRTCVSLPIYPSLTNAEVDKVIGAWKSLV